MTTLDPVDIPAAWRGDQLSRSTEWIRRLTDAEHAELVQVGERFIADDPKLQTATAADYPLRVCSGLIAECGEQLDSGRGFILVRGLDPVELGDMLCGAIFFVMGLHLGDPMRQNEAGDLIDHVIATSSRSMEDGAMPSRIRDRLPFHSDSSDVVALMCLRPSMEGGASSLVSGATIYNTMLERRPELAARLFDEYHWDWKRQDPNAPADTYVSPIISHVDGVFSSYAGSMMVFSAQEYDGVPELTADQREALELYDEIAQEDGLAIDMDFQPGDIQWLLNYAALHSRTEYNDWPEPERRRHLMRLWLKRDVGRPLVEGFGKNAVVKDRADDEAGHDERVERIASAVVPDFTWGN
ncbi:MAG: TauD/TfdA family dioxygenase [Actinomycetota bacterium]